MNSTTISEERTRQIIRQVKLELYVDAPLSVDELADRIGVEDRGRMNEIMGKMISSGSVSTTPDWKYRLGTRVKNSLENESDLDLDR